MTLHRTGGLAALTCPATYLAGFALLVTLLAPLGYGTTEIDSRAVVAVIDARPGVLIAWNSTICILNALALAVLVVTLSQAQTAATPGWVAVTQGLGLLTGLGWLATIVPAFGDTAGAVFGLGAIAWFMAVGAVLLGGRERSVARPGIA